MLRFFLLIATCLFYLPLAADSLALLKVDRSHPEPLFKDSGDYNWSIQTASGKAQAYFTQGILLCYGFNFAEAVRSFRAAEMEDPTCAACYWGEALALSECISLLGEEACHAGGKAIRKAQTLSSRSSPVMKALIEALIARFSLQSNHCTLNNKSYAQKMKEVFKAYPDNADVIALYAKAEMDVLDMHQDMLNGEPTGYTKELITTLDQAMKRYPAHPGLNHFAIHVFEECGIPLQALGAAERLDGLVPMSGHLQHMPAHIYYVAGRYHDASMANLRGIAADNALLQQGGVVIPEFAGFYLHNYFYLFRSLMMEGRSQEAIQTATQLIAKMQSGQLPSNPYLSDVFSSVPYLLMARFGMWDAINESTAPAKSNPFATAMWHYSRGLAAIREGNRKAAKEELTSINTNGLDKFPPLAKIVTIATLDLSAQMTGNNKRAIADLKKAVEIEDQLHLEMLPWYLSMRQALGTALLESGSPDEAESIFSEDLDRSPKNGWALFGLMKSLEAKRQKSQAEGLRREYISSWKNSDFPLSSPRF